MSGSLNVLMAGQVGMEDHSHAPIEIPANYPVPKLGINLFIDDKSGFNLHLQLADFELEAPEFAADKPISYVQGHAHLFINGQKIQPIYGKYLHLPAKLFKKGINQVMVTLNNHDHWQDEFVTALAEWNVSRVFDLRVDSANEQEQDTQEM